MKVKNKWKKIKVLSLKILILIHKLKVKNKWKKIKILYLKIKNYFLQIKIIIYIVKIVKKAKNPKNYLSKNRILNLHRKAYLNLWKSVKINIFTTPKITCIFWIKMIKLKRKFKKVKKYFLNNFLRYKFWWLWFKYK